MANSIASVPLNLQNPGLRNFLNELMREVNVLAGHGEVERVTINPSQSAITNLNAIKITLDSGIVYKELQNMATDIKNISDKVDTILVALRAANIIGT